MAFNPITAPEESSCIMLLLSALLLYPLFVYLFQPKRSTTIIMIIAMKTP